MAAYAKEPEDKEPTSPGNEQASCEAGSQPAGRDGDAWLVAHRRRISNMVNEINEGVERRQRRTDARILHKNPGSDFYA